jgi:hypothetical protein
MSKMTRKRKRELRELTSEFVAQVIANMELLNERFDDLSEDEVLHCQAVLSEISERICPGQTGQSQ